MEFQEWQMAREWLRFTGAVPPGSKINTDCDLFDLAQALRDGVILCEVANTLKRGAIRDFTRTTHLSAFFCFKNIRSFLKACDTIFHIPQKELFSPNDLYDVSDFQKVIHVLSLLSKTDSALSINLNPFPNDDLPVENHVHNDKEEIYSRLEDAVAGSRDIDQEKDDIYDPVTIADSEKIYEDIVQCVKAGQALSAKEPVPQDKRSHVVSEIVQTEENYVNALKVMIEHFIRPLKTSLKTHDKEIIFMNTEKLCEIHIRFYSQLKPPGKALNLQTFLEFSKEFLEYASYCSRMQDAQQQVSELCKDTKFNQLVEECKRKSGRKFPLHEQLIVPFQRILKYPLLLRELLKQTPPGHPERELTEKVFDLMEDIARYINMYKKDDEMKRAIAKIEASVKDDLCHNDRMYEYGRFVSDGEVQVKFASEEKNKTVRRYAFLFDKFLLFCKPRGELYEMKEKLDLKKFKVDEEVAHPGKGKFSFGWNIHAITADGVTERNDCTIHVQSSNVRDRWVTNLKMCTDAIQLTRVQNIGKHKFELNTFSTTTWCSVCQKLLWGLISQGFRCDGCQFSVHYDCIPKCPECLRRGIKQVPGQDLGPGRYEKNKITLFDQKQSPPVDIRGLLRNFEWFVGVMNRTTASEKLQKQPDGTYLVRESDNQKGSFVLSVVYKNESKHIKIVYHENSYCLTDNVQFKTIPELIDYYKRNTLGLNFPTLPTVLRGTIPSRDYVIAKYDYNARNNQELSLKKDARITVLKREGNWWYGETEGVFGFFPKTYVEDVQNGI